MFVRHSFCRSHYHPFSAATPTGADNTVRLFIIMTRSGLAIYMRTKHQIVFRVPGIMKCISFFTCHACCINRGCKYTTCVPRRGVFIVRTRRGVQPTAVLVGEHCAVRTLGLCTLLFAQAPTSGFQATRSSRTRACAASNSTLRIRRASPTHPSAAATIQFPFSCRDKIAQILAHTHTHTHTAVFRQAWHKRKTMTINVSVRPAPCALARHTAHDTKPSCFDMPHPCGSLRRTSSG